jgi:hypothetical protein
MEGVGRSTLYEILQDSKKNTPIESPAKRFKKTQTRINFDSFNRDAVRCEIYSIYERKEHLTLSKLKVICTIT